MTNASRSMRRALVGAAAATLLACDTDVKFPGVIAGTDFDPSADAATLSLSAQSDLYRALNGITHFSAFFSQEAWVGAVRQETNDIGRRVATAGTSDVSSSLWSPLQRAIATNELAIQTLSKGASAGSDLNLARAYMNAGFGLELLAEHFCQGTFLVGPPLTPAQVSDTAIARFTKAITIASTITAAAEATKMVNASNVGLARAKLQKKDFAGAAAAAALVPASFVYNAINVDDASNRGLGNGIFNYDLSALIIVPDPYRALNDPRVAWKDGGKKAQDTQFQYYQQLKYTSYATPIRIASGLEASYIAAEAKLGTGDQSAALVLIAARRTAGGQPAFTGTGAAAILAELMNQRAREFWLEAKHAGDIVRNPAAAAFVSPAGSPFYKPAQGTFGAATCLPVPLSEINANPNFPRS
jgi:starch-binding outer membrane protein, SusD/RagB family